jgi:hypothetical protein
VASLHGLVVPTEVAALIVPAAAVAEIIAHPSALKPLPATSPWVLGYFRWRNYPVTLVSFERLAADREMSGFSRVCVFYPLPGRDSAEADVLPAQVSSQFTAGALRIGDHTYVIPDFDRLKAAFYNE